MGVDDYLYTRITNINMNKTAFDDKIDNLKALNLQVKTTIGSLPDDVSVVSLINSQRAKLLVEKEDLNKQIDDLSAKIDAKDTEFVDIKKNANNTTSILFNQQDYITMMLYSIYISLSVIVYWYIITKSGFSSKGLISYILGWLIITVILFSLLNRFV
jgi:hypothetical protein